MKKLLKLITMLFLASAMVISCGGSGSGSDVPSTSDCTKTVSTLELSDGEWTVSMNLTADFAASKMELKATVTDGTYEFTSGEVSGTIDMEKAFSLMGDEMVEEMEMTAEEAIAMLKNMSDDEKNAMLESMLASIGEEIPEGYKVSWDGLDLNIEVTLSADDLEGVSEFLDIEELPEGSEIKTNADNTKYTINFGFEDEVVGALNVEIIAKKK